AEGAEWKVVVERRAAQLQPRSALDVAGQQRQRHAVVAAQGVEQRTDAGQLADARALVQLETGDVRVPERRHSRIDFRFAPAGIAKNHVRDLRIGAPREIVAAQLTAIAENFKQSSGEGLARRAAVTDQSAVDVEEN